LNPHPATASLQRDAAAAELPRPARAPTLTPTAALAWAAWFGLVGGHLDLVGLVLRTQLITLIPYGQGPYFPWSVPVANLALLLMAGLVVALVNRLRPGGISARGALWFYATLALWGPMLRLPLFGLASLVLAAGVGRWISRVLERRGPGFGRFLRSSLVGLFGVLGVLALLTTGRQAWTEARAAARLPAPPRGAKNVLLLVMDAVRADRLSLYGYTRDTTPHLIRWARRGVRFDAAMAPAPWTFPSHGSFLTGCWPHALSRQWRPVLETPDPTLAEFLSSHGYRTAGFVANTTYCSYETRMNRGFAHYEDYPLTLRNLLGSSAPGRWLVSNLLPPSDFYSRKWIRYQSRDAVGLNRALLDWLSRQRDDRPFFAFLNYLDAHEPFVTPPGQGRHFGLRPESLADGQMLLDYWNLDKRQLTARDITLASDGYDDGIAFLDQQIGALLDALDRRGVLRETVVIIAADHGEMFGEHRIFTHGYSLYWPEIHVPLVILAPGGPVGQVVPEPVSLRDLPATVLDLLGLSADSPFPGHSLAAHWRGQSEPGQPSGTLAVSESAMPKELHPSAGVGPSQRGLALSLVAGGRHYLRDSAGTEELYDLASDLQESNNRIAAPEEAETVGQFRRTLLELLSAAPTALGAPDPWLTFYREELDAKLHGRPAPRRQGPWMPQGHIGPVMR
jgi:arylsulfatase A-like enzyme